MGGAGPAPAGSTGNADVRRLRAAILAIPVGLGAALAFEVPFFPYGPGFLVGVALGTLVVFLAERTVVPERLRGAGI